MASPSFLTGHRITQIGEFAPGPCKEASPEKTPGAWFLGWKNAEAPKAPEILRKAGRTKGEMAEDLATFQLGLPGCSKGCRCWAGREDLTTWAWLGSSVSREGSHI